MQISIYNGEINLVRHVKAIPNNLWTIASSKNITAVYDNVVDIKIPFETIEIDDGDTLDFYSKCKLRIELTFTFLTKCCYQ